jgi:hypothetical protein
VSCSKFYSAEKLPVKIFDSTFVKVFIAQEEGVIKVAKRENQKCINTDELFSWIQARLRRISE